MPQTNLPLQSPINRKRIINRRIKVFGLMLLSTLLATAKMDTSYSDRFNHCHQNNDDFTVCADFCLDCSLFLVQHFRFFELLGKRKVPGIVWSPEETPLQKRVAVLMPVYNESPQSVYANLLAMAQELSQTGQGQSL